ncbi:hypothetical protein A1359_13555 [Methylomonas lenta]|uniref:Uncharacterized protein n=1 Tax=Methylomonas lenta TaxID=980561 RepID=A0A177N409_9GAMM|nr:hypothetical protein A1359_13555 [Methylomonas lenta]
MNGDARAVGCGKQRAPHRSRLVRFVNSPHPTPALAWTFAIGTLVSSGFLAIFSRLGAAEVMALSFSKGHVQSLFSKNGG